MKKKANIRRWTTLMVCGLWSMVCSLSLAQTVPLRWDVETSRGASFALELRRGETINLEPRFLSYGAPINVTNCAVVMRYNTSTMGAAYYSTNGAALSPGTNGRVRVTWSPLAEPTNSSLNYVIACGTTMRAFGSLKLMDTVGYSGTNTVVSGELVDWATLDHANLTSAPFVTNAYTTTPSGTGCVAKVGNRLAITMPADSDTLQTVANRGATVTTPLYLGEITISSPGAATTPNMLKLTGVNPGDPSTYRGGVIAWSKSGDSAPSAYTYVNMENVFSWDTAPQDTYNDTGPAWIDFDDGSASFANGGLTISSTGVPGGWGAEQWIEGALTNGNPRYVLARGVGETGSLGMTLKWKHDNWLIFNPSGSASAVITLPTIDTNHCQFLLFTLSNPNSKTVTWANSGNIYWATNGTWSTTARALGKFGRVSIATMGSKYEAILIGTNSASIGYP